MPHRFTPGPAFCFVLLTLLAACSCLRGAPASPVGPAAGDADWQQVGWGGGGFFYCAVYHPKQDGVIYMGGDVGGAYKTEDGGLHWRTINNGLASYGVFSLAVDRRNPDTVYAATETGLCKSTDAGEHWLKLPLTGRKDLRLTGEKGKSIRSIAVDPTDGNVVYAASPSGKVYKSIDGGQTWTLSYERKPVGEEPGTLRVQYGKVNGAYYGDLWQQVAFPTDAAATDCLGVGFTAKGDGSLPKDSFLIIKTRTGGTYRSRNLNTLYKNTEWSDIVLKAEDFVVDPDFAKNSPKAAASLAAVPDWSAIVRMDMTCSGPLPTAASVVKLRRFFFALTPVATEPAAPAATPRLVGILDFGVPGAEKSIKLDGNIRVGPPSSGPIYSVAVSPSNPSWVIAATHDAGLVLSKDAGRTWTELGTPKYASNVTFSPSNPRVIYGSFFTGGVLKSDDAGLSWTRLSDTFAKKASILEVAVSPANPLDVYAMGVVGWTGLFYISHDGGKTWKNSAQLTIDAQSGNPTMDGLYSGNMAALSAPSNIALNPRNPKEIFLSANWRACLSTDGGLTWTERDAGADISCITDIRFLKGKTYVTAMDEGTFSSDNNGKSWRQLWPLRHTPGLSGHNWRVAVNEINGAVRIITTATPWYMTPTSVVRSEDDGKTFKVVQSGIPNYIIQPNTMWGQGHPRALAVDPNDPQIVYFGIDGDPAGGKSGGGIFKSQDGGATWAQLPNQPASRRMFYGLAVDPTDSKRIFWAACSDKGGVHRSTDQGATWEHVFRNEIFMWNVVVTADGTVYASGQQLWRSTDHGVTWKQLTSLKGDLPMVGLEVHPRDAKTIWVATTTWDGTRGGAVYKTTDGGATWKTITGNLPYVGPEILRFNPATNELWAGWVGLFKIKQ